MRRGTQKNFYTLQSMGEKIKNIFQDVHIALIIMKFIYFVQMYKNMLPIKIARIVLMLHVQGHSKDFGYFKTNANGSSKQGMVEGR